MSSDTLAFGDWDVTFTDGAAISSVKQRTLNTDILLTNLSSSFSNAELQQEIARFGSASVMRNTIRKHARIRLMDPTAAKALMVELDNKRLGPSRVSANLDRSKDVQWLEDGILLEYDRCQTSATVVFEEKEQADVGLNLNRAMFHGRKIRVTREEDKILLVEDLPAIFDQDDILLLFMAHSVSITRDYADDSATSDMLQSLIREQPGCASLRLVPLPTGLEEGAGWIRMSNDERVVEVSKEIRGLRPIFLGGNVVNARRSQAVVWKLVKDQYNAVKAQIEQLNHDDVHILLPSDADDSLEVRAISSDSRRLRTVKTTLNVTIRGELWKVDDAPLWDRHWVTDEGRQFINETNGVSAAFVQVNLSERTIYIAGQEEARVCAKVMLQSHLDSLDALQHRIKLPKELMEVFIEHGMPQLSQTLSRFESKIGRSVDVNFKGTDTTRQRVLTVIDQCSSELLTRSSNGPRPVCPVCTSDVNEPLDLECGHAYCAECLIHLVTSAVDFPIQCIFGECQYVPPLRSLQRIISPLQYRRLLENSFRQHLRGHERLYECPSTGCTQLWIQPEDEDGQRRRQITQCSSCLIRICTACKVEEHNGMTCDEFQRSKSLHRSERLLATWRAERGHDVKECPNCGALSEKVDGCPHIHCAQCKKHWCWECSRCMSRAELVYAHIRRRHGWAADRWLAPLNL